MPTLISEAENNIRMAPQELVAALLNLNERQGQELLRTTLPSIDDDSLDLLVNLMKREADRQWAKNLVVHFSLRDILCLLAISSLIHMFTHSV